MRLKRLLPCVLIDFVIATDSVLPVQTGSSLVFQRADGLRIRKCLLSLGLPLLYLGATLGAFDLGGADLCLSKKLLSYNWYNSWGQWAWPARIAHFAASWETCASLVTVVQRVISSHFRHPGSINIVFCWTVWFLLHALISTIDLVELVSALPMLLLILLRLIVVVVAVWQRKLTWVDIVVIFTTFKSYNFSRVVAVVTITVRSHSVLPRQVAQTTACARLFWNLILACKAEFVLVRLRERWLLKQSMFFSKF